MSLYDRITEARNPSWREFEERSFAFSEIAEFMNDFMDGPYMKKNVEAAAAIQKVLSWAKDQKKKARRKGPKTAYDYFIQRLEATEPTEGAFRKLRNWIEVREAAAGTAAREGRARAKRRGNTAG